jgi:hypothetical protein
LHLDICGVGGDRGATVRVLSGTPNVAEGSTPIARKVTHPLPVKRRRKEVIELEAACVTVALREVVFNQNLAQTRLHVGDELLFRGRTDSRPIDFDEPGEFEDVCRGHEGRRVLHDVELACLGTLPGVFSIPTEMLVASHSGSKVRGADACCISVI